MNETPYLKLQTDDKAYNHKKNSDSDSDSSESVKYEEDYDKKDDDLKNIDYKLNTSDITNSILN